MNIKTLTITNVVLVVAVVALFILQFNSGKETTKEKEEKEETKEAQHEVILEQVEGQPFKIAYVNSDTVAAYYDFSKQMTTKLKSSQSSAESKLKGMYANFEKQQKAFETEAPIMGQEEMQRKYQELGAMQQTIMQKEQELSSALAQKEAEVMTTYVYETDKFMQVVGKELGYDYVMSYRVGGPMLYANPDLDITAKVVEMLNKEYKKSKESKQPSTEK
jgi:outer membrane protein